jgi:hypothetical protein
MSGSSAEHSHLNTAKRLEENATRKESFDLVDLLTTVSSQLD